MLGRLAARLVVEELRRLRGHVVHDHVGHHVQSALRRRERRQVGPVSQARVHPRVVDRIEAGVGAVDRMEERQQVHAAEAATQRIALALREQRLQRAQVPAAQAVDIGDELDLVLHGRSRVTGGGSDGARAGAFTRSVASAASSISVPARRSTLAGSPCSTVS